MKNQLHTTPDEHLEARITAWVLGQASPFEVAELEALCAEDPVLQSFYERTKELHSLLLETPPSASDQFWKLSPERRAKLDPIIGPQESTHNKDSSIRRAGYRAAFGIAAVLTVTLFIKRYIIISPPMMKEASTIVTYESAPEKASFSRQAQEESFYSNVELERKSESNSLSIPRTPAQPRDSAPAATSERDSGMTKADSVMDETFASGGGGGADVRFDHSKSRQKLAEPAKAEKSKKIKSSPSAKPIEDAEIASLPSPAVAAPKPSSTFGKGNANDGGIGYDSVHEKSDMSNTASAIQALGMTRSLEVDRSNSVPAPKSVTAPTAETSKPSVDFGNGKDFGKDWESAEGEGVDAFAATDSKNKGGFKYEPGATKEQEALSSYGSNSQGGLNSERGEKLKNETSSATVPGVPSATGTPNQITPGLRSGDTAVRGAWIDAVLNDPNKNAEVNQDHAKAPAEENSIGGQSFNGTLAQREIARRQNNITEADRKLIEGREAYAKGDYAQATDKYKEALANLPNTPAPALDDRRESYSQHLADASVAQAQQMRKVGKYDEASVLLKQAESLSPQDARIKNELAYLEDPLRTNPAATFEHAEKVDEVRRSLYKAQGNYDLGKYDDAKKSYEEILRIDPFNDAARRGMEKVENTKNDYYRAAYSNTRSELLMEVDKAWELAVPADATAVPFGTLAQKDKDSSTVELDPFTAKPLELEGFINYGSPIQGEAKQIDITTKFVEVAQENNKELAFNWFLSGENQKVDGVNHIPVTPASPAVLPEASESELTILGDIPVLGKLFKAETPSLIDLSEEISAEKETFSTFSLNISDASFQLALAAIEKGERPDPTSIKPEQFYNAVDYGDPAPSASEPVAAAIDQTAHPVIPGRNLVRVALRTGSTGRSAAQPLRLTLLVDQSGSMVREDRRAAMETALASLATLLTENDQVTVIGFSRTPHLLAQSLPGNQAAKLPDLINQTASEGGTNLEQAINLATEQALSHHLAGAQNRIVLFTDGAANLGDADPDRLSEKIKNIRQQGLAFDIAGIGTNELNDRLLSDLARHGNGRYYLVGEKTGGNLATQLAGAFRPAAENVKVQVKLNPQRVGNYKLIGFEKDRLKTEDFRNDAVDAAELAADEAGVALYQVETLPQGTGEIGEVSVRFRDTASGEMVERTWTIPYDASAPSLDKANPKTQLATLALLAAQKLQPGPMADAIDFSNYSETIAKLKQANAKSAKTQQLFNLINALK